jgi:nucleoid DNA-binding protein
MTKADIARRIHQKAGISEQEAATLLDWILELFKTTLQKGESIAILGFGTFKVRHKLSRKAWNFITGESLVIPARRVVSFHASAHLKTEVNAVPAEVKSCSADWIDRMGLADNSSMQEGAHAENGRY